MKGLCFTNRAVTEPNRYVGQLIRVSSSGSALVSARVAPLLPQLLDCLALSI